MRDVRASDRQINMDASGRTGGIWTQNKLLVARVIVPMCASSPGHTCVLRREAVTSIYEALRVKVKNDDVRVTFIFIRYYEQSYVIMLCFSCFYVDLPCESRA